MAILFFSEHTNYDFSAIRPKKHEYENLEIKGKYRDKVSDHLTRGRNKVFSIMEKPVMWNNKKKATQVLSITVSIDLRHRIKDLIFRVFSRVFRKNESPTPISQHSRTSKENHHAVEFSG